MKKNNEVFTVKEFAFILNVHMNTVRNAIKYGRIHAFRIGTGPTSAYRIFRSELDRMAAFDLTEIIENIVKERKKE